MTILDELLLQWQSLKPATAPPNEAVPLWQHGGCVIYIDNKLGPRIPYPAVEHEDGTRNHGYTHLKGNKDAIQRIPELQGWPAFAELVEAINEPGSPIESVGCEIGYFDVSDNGGPPWMLGAYVDVIFSNTVLNESPENFLQLAARLIQAVEGCEQWWGSVELGLQRLRGLTGVAEPWGLMIRICNHGRDKDEAYKFWQESASRLSTEALRLQKDFPRNDTTRM